MRSSRRGSGPSGRRATGRTCAPRLRPAFRCRGRISVRPRALQAIAAQLDGTGVQWLAEVGVGTIHVAAGAEHQLAAARAAAETHGGWLLREAGAPDIDGFGRALPNLALQARLAAAFDPDGKLGRGKLPLAPSPVDADGTPANV